MVENKLIPRITSNGMWEIIRTPGGGEIPDVLKGIWTSSTAATRAIDIFQKQIQDKVKKSSGSRSSNKTV